MSEIELVLLLLVAVAALTPVARALHVPYPILLVLGGLCLALLPILPHFQLTPDLVFLLFLPPLVFSAAFTASIRDLRALLRPLISLAVGLVLATTFAVAVVLHALMPQVGWPVAFAFGAIVSPPDAVAAAAVLRGLGVPRKIVTLLEDESLINDATALVTLRAALAASAVAFTAGDAAVGFLVVGGGGVVIGLIVGVLIGQLHRVLNDPPVEITLSLLTPFAAYLPAESLGVSGVLSTVTAGLYLGWRAPYVMHSEARLRGRAVWDMVEFLLNGLVFILIGLQLSTILPTLEGYSIATLIGLGLVLSLTVILVRIAWVFMDMQVKRFSRGLSRFRRSQPEPSPMAHAHNWRDMFVVGWAGMRGVVSLAAALALPEATPERSLLIFLTFFVILATLVGQGLSLPPIIRAVGVTADDEVVEQQEMHARRVSTEAAISRIEGLRNEWPTHLPLIDTLQSQYEHRFSHLGNSRNGENNGSGSMPGEEGNGGEETSQELLEHHLIRRSVLETERTAVLDLLERGEIDNSVWRRIERDLDLEELRMDA